MIIAESLKRDAAHFNFVIRVVVFSIGRVAQGDPNFRIDRSQPASFSEK